LAQGQPQRAADILEEALRRSPGNGALLAETARLRLGMGQAEAALAGYRTVLGHAPRDVAALNGQGVALDLLGRHAEAQNSYEAAQKIEPGNLAAANNRALSMLLQGQAAPAAALFAALDQPGASERIRQNHAIARIAAGGETDDPDLRALARALN
jgi:Flp pilus assembly protein TadD